MKKLNLNLGNIKSVLSEKEMKKISGGVDSCRLNDHCSGHKCEEKINGTWTCSDCCIA